MKTSHSFNNVACGFQNILISQKLIIFHSCASLLLALFRNLFTWCTLLQTAALPHRVPLNFREEIYFYSLILSYWCCLFKTCVQLLIEYVGTCLSGTYAWSNLKVQIWYHTAICLYFSATTWIILYNLLSN